MSKPKSHKSWREPITVILLPSSARRQPLRWHTTRRMLAGLMAAGALSCVLFVSLVAYLAVGGDLFRKHAESSELRKAHSELTRTIEQREQVATELDQMREFHDTYVQTTQGKITNLHGQIQRIADFAGLPLDVETTPAVAKNDTGHGEGGPLMALVAGMDVAEPETVLPARHIERLDDQILHLDMLAMALDDAETQLARREDLLANTPLIVPINGTYSLTSRFGWRRHPVYKRRDFHNGQDFAAKRGTPILAPADGVVSFVGVWGKKPGYGRMVRLNHGKGLFFESDGAHREVEYATRYGHCQRILVKKGQRVRRGDTIALVGNTGVSTGNHVHYEILADGKNVDPARFLLNR